MKISLYSCVMLLLAPLVICGCGPDLSHLPPTVEAKGTVTLDGTPVDGAAISFITETSKYHSTAISDKAGKFDLRAFKEKPGAVPGKYRVEINKTVVSGAGSGNADGGEGAALNVAFGLPKKYASMVTSGIIVDIPESGISNINLELKSN